MLKKLQLVSSEPDVASSDAANMECSLCREEDSYVINGKKWWSSGEFLLMSPNLQH